MSGIRNVSQGITDFVEWATDPRPRIGLGLPFFDSRTRGGMAKAECLMVLAYSSAGKTWLALNAIANNPEVPTLVFSLEMSWRQDVARIATLATGVPTWELEQQLASTGFSGPLLESARRFPLLLGDDSSEKSVKEMHGDVRKAGDLLGTPIRLIVIDYLELIGGQGMLGKAEQVDKAAQKIRALAKDNDCSVIVLHQVGKADGTGGFEPLSLDSGKYGGHQPMDYVVGMYAPRLDRKLSGSDRDAVETDVYLQLLKNRNGKAHPGGIRHTLDPNIGRITPYGVHIPLPGHGHQASFAIPAPDPAWRAAS